MDRFLRFVGNYTNCQFAVLLLSLSAAPWVFSKCMVVVSAFLRRWGV